VISYQQAERNLATIHDFDGFGLQVIRTNHETSRFPLTLNIYHSQEELLLDAEYDVGILQKEDMMLMIEKYKMLLKQLAQNPDNRIGWLNLETEEELARKSRRLPIDFNF
ncbi:MAG: condensation domain-containing protein, partial [Cyclobacteriaceae bacterium]